VGLPESDPADTSCQKTVGNKAAPVSGVQAKWPFICEITPRTERAIYRDNMRIQSFTGFFRLQDTGCQPTAHKAEKIRVTGYLLWDDEHNEAQR
jgi:hypothetical protein